MASKSLQVENAILADLENMSPRPFYIERFEGPFSEEVLARWLAGVQKPSVAVFYSGGPRDPGSNSERGAVTRMTARFEVWIIHDRLRGYETGMVETGGVQDLLDASFVRLAGSRVGLVWISPLEFVSEDHVATEESTGTMVWSQMWKTDFIR